MTVSMLATLLSESVEASLSDCVSGSSAEHLSSPSVAYWSNRYLLGTDNWTRVQHETTLLVPLIEALRPISGHGSMQMLEAGCGTMWASLAIKEAIPSVAIHGVDFAMKAILSRYPDLPVTLSRAGLTCEEADFLEIQETSAFDVVFDGGLLHHLVPSDWPSYRRKVLGVLRPGGVLLLRAFHPTDGNWDAGMGAGGHIRKGYYCHYHTAESVASILGDDFQPPAEVGRARHREHVECLYRAVRSS